MIFEFCQLGLKYFPGKFAFRKFIRGLCSLRQCAPNQHIEPINFFLCKIRCKSQTFSLPCCFLNTFSAPQAPDPRALTPNPIFNRLTIDQLESRTSSASGEQVLEVQEPGLLKQTSRPQETVMILKPVPPSPLSDPPL